MLTGHLRRCARQLSGLTAAAFNAEHGRQAAAGGQLLARLRGRRRGLFLIPQLTRESGFAELVEEARSRTSGLLAEALDTDGRRRPLVQIFDDMSDCLCRVADMADCVRQLHPLPGYRQAAEDACVAIATVVESLNTNFELYERLRSGVLGHSDTRRFGLDSVDQRVGEMFLDDFLLSGIHLPESARRQFVAETERAFLLGAEFARGASLPTQLPDGSLLHDALGEHPDRRMRLGAFAAFYSHSRRQEEALVQLLSARSRIADLTGFRSFADRANVSAILGGSDQVAEFLQQLSSRLRPLVARDCETMAAMLDGQQPAIWDLQRLADLRKNQCFPGGSDADIEEFFSVGNCLQGVSHVMQRLFNARLELAEPEFGELWHGSVAKLAVVDCADNAPLGHVYCDLYQRKDRPAQDCHFTIRGGRRLPDGEYQLPIVCLQLQCPSPSRGRPSLLTASGVENLFHEFGHAVHSMLGRTRYQHVTGTRCGTDFAEVPSTLLELFAFQSCVLDNYATHWRTGEPLPRQLHEPLRRSRRALPAAHRQQQVLYSLVDLGLHSGQPPADGTTAEFHRLAAEHSGLAYPPAAARQHRFTHLVGYGAKYYAYLVSKALSALVWETRFAENPLDPAAGSDLHKFVLGRGGEECPKRMIRQLTGRDVTAAQLAESLMRDTSAQYAR